MSETAYIDELLKAEQSANEIISNAQRERYTVNVLQATKVEGSQISCRERSQQIQAR